MPVEPKSRSRETAVSSDLSFDEEPTALPNEHPREGWAEAAEELARLGDDGRIWPEFGNIGDEDGIYDPTNR